MYIAAHRDTETQDAYEISYVVRRDAFAMYRTIATRRGGAWVWQESSPLSCFLLACKIAPLQKESVCVGSSLATRDLCSVSETHFPICK